MAVAVAAAVAAAAAAEVAAIPQAEAAAGAFECLHPSAVSAAVEISVAALAALAQNHLPSWLDRTSCIPSRCVETGALPAECGVHRADLALPHNSIPSLSL